MILGKCDTRRGSHRLYVDRQRLNVEHEVTKHICGIRRRVQLGETLFGEGLGAGGSGDEIEILASNILACRSKVRDERAIASISLDYGVHVKIVSLLCRTETTRLTGWNAGPDP